MTHIIVGNGILGMSLAFRLIQKSPTSQVIIIGPRTRLGGATPAAGAMLNSFAEVDESSLRSTEDLLHFEASYLATKMWPEFERQLIEAAGDNLPKECKSCQIFTGGCYSTGTYIVNNATSDELDDKNYDAIAKALDHFNEQYESVDPKSIPNYAPAAGSRALRALFIQNEGWLNPKVVLEKLDNILKASNQVTVIDDEVVKFTHQNDRVTSVITKANGTVVGDTYTLANGFACSSLIKASAPDLSIQPIYSGVGVSLEIKTQGFPHKAVIRTPNRGGACGIYSVPYFKGPGQSNCHVLIGASNFVSPTPKFNARISSVAHLLDSAINEINQNFYSAELINVNVGNRPTSLDQYPLLGQAGFSNLFMANGTKRDGFHLSPIISDFVASKILQTNPLLDLELFSPTRQVIRNISRDDAINLTVNSLMSEQYQHGFVASNIRQVEQLKREWKGQVTKVHDEAGAADWGIPPLMFNLYRDKLIPTEWLKQ
jgi:glycine oxidase